MQIDFSKPVVVKPEVLARRPDLKHYQGKQGYVAATGDYPSNCMVQWPGFVSFFNTSDLQNAA